MFIQSLIEKSAEAKLGHVLVDYDVPLKKEVGKGSLKAVNWPKGFYVGGLRPPGPWDDPRTRVVSTLKPSSAEGYRIEVFNVTKFFDSVAAIHRLEEGLRSRSSRPARPAQEG